MACMMSVCSKYMLMIKKCSMSEETTLELVLVRRYGKKSLEDGALHDKNT